MLNNINILHYLYKMAFLGQIVSLFGPMVATGAQQIFPFVANVLSKTVGGISSVLSKKKELGPGGAQYLEPARLPRSNFMPEGLDPSTAIPQTPMGYALRNPGLALAPMNAPPITQYANTYEQQLGNRFPDLKKRHPPNLMKQQLQGWTYQ